MLLFLNLAKEHYQADQFVVYGIQFLPFLQCGTLAYIGSSVTCLLQFLKHGQQTLPLHNCNRAFLRKSFREDTIKNVKITFPFIAILLNS